MSSRLKRDLIAIPFLLLSVLFSPGVLAAIHEVTVGDNFFSPSELTIQVGDTVRWVNAGGGNIHNVTSTDDSWVASGTSDSFTFDVVFDEAGTFSYLCTVHGGSMSGTITVEGGAVEEFFINSGLNDAWVNDNADFQGLFFTVFPDLGLFFLSWFTFDSVLPAGPDTATFGAHDQRWVTASGVFSPGDTVNLNIELTSGGIFNASDPLAMQNPNYGTMTIVFNNCDEAIVTYNFPGLGISGQMTLSRAAPDNIPLCEALNAELQSG